MYPAKNLLFERHGISRVGGVLYIEVEACDLAGASSPGVPGQQRVRSVLLLFNQRREWRLLNK